MRLRTLSLKKETTFKKGTLAGLIAMSFRTTGTLVVQVKEPAGPAEAIMWNSFASTGTFALLSQLVIDMLVLTIPSGTGTEPRMAG
jgi:hypothetical protein